MLLTQPPARYACLQNHTTNIVQYRLKSVKYVFLKNYMKRQVNMIKPIKFSSKLQRTSMKQKSAVYKIMLEVGEIRLLATSGSCIP